MSRAGEVIPMAIPVFNLLWWAGKRIAQRVRARRAGLVVPPITAATVAEGIGRGLNALPPLSNARMQKGLDTARDLLDTVPDDDSPTPGERPKHKGVR
jgi:hypothetical protein